MAWKGKESHFKTWHDRIRDGNTMQHKERKDNGRNGKIWQGNARQGKER